MTGRELDELLDGQAGVRLFFTNGEHLDFERRDLESPAAWRLTMRRALGQLDYRPPALEQDDHDELVRALFRFADVVERERREAA